MLPKILTHEDYHDHYWLIRNHTAFKKEFKTSGKGECWQGGRLRYFIPNVETDDATGFVHYYTGSKLEFPYWLDWYKGPDPTRAPVTDDKRYALLSYYGFGGDYNKSYTVGQITNTGWYICVTCKIEHNYITALI